MFRFVKDGLFRSYGAQQGLSTITTETGAGQWGTALSEAAAHYGLDCEVFMVKCSYEQKPFRRNIMQTFGANVTPSPSAYRTKSVSHLGAWGCAPNPGENLSRRNRNGVLKRSNR